VVGGIATVASRRNGGLTRKTTRCKKQHSRFRDSEIQRFRERLGSQQISRLPLAGRTFISLAALAPGVALPPASLLPRINGGRPRTNEYLFDGISVLQPEPGQVAFFPVMVLVLDRRRDMRDGRSTTRRTPNTRRARTLRVSPLVTVPSVPSVHSVFWIEARLVTTAVGLASFTMV